MKLNTIKYYTYFLSIILLLSSCHNMRVEVYNIPSNTPENAEIFITGEFNNWDPGDPDYILTQVNDTIYYVDLPRGIGELEYKLGNADVIDTTALAKDRAVFGCKVILENIETGEDVEYLLVGPDESDVTKGRISVASPLGQAIIGKIPGDEVVLNAPGGKRHYELIEIL